ncbi:Tyrosine recombinase XerC, partial [termite gut metagenome]
AKWDTDKQRVKNGCTNKLQQNASEINADLLKHYSRIQEIFKEFEVSESMPTPQQLKDAFNRKYKKEVTLEPAQRVPVLLDVFDEFVKGCGMQNNWREATYEKFATIKKYLQGFDSELTIDALDETRLNDYVNYLRDTKNLRNSTTGKQIDFLKCCLRWSKRKGYPTNPAFETFKPKLKTTRKKVIFLTLEELNRLREYPIPARRKYLERVRDVFLFCCFTGLRYSDVFNLKRSDVKTGHIEITTVKTADSLLIELNNHSRSILEKYKDVPFERDKALPVIGNQRMNTYLKELGELCGIDEPVGETYYKGNERIDVIAPKYALLGSHVGRRTFICNALSLGIPAQVVMKWTGHSDYTAMKPYIDIADDIKASAMDKFNRL